MRKLMIIPAFHRANLLSLVGLCFAILSMYTTITGPLTRAVMFMVGAVLCDLFDGKFASRFERNTAEKQMGELVDSLVDMISFVALPIVFLIIVTNFSPLSVGISCFYAIMAVSRLSYFHVTKEDQLEADGQYRFFIGVPVTYILLVVPILYTLFELFGAVQTTVFQAILQTTYIIMGGLFVWKRPIPKPAGMMYAVFVLLAVIILTVLISR